MIPLNSTNPLLLLGAGADSTDVQYATGFSAPDPFLLLLRGNTRTVVVSILEAGRARKTNPPLRVITTGELALPPKSRRDLGAQALALLQAEGLASVSVSSRCPVGVVRTLEKGGLRVKLMPDPVFPQRLVKTEAELTRMRKAQRAAVAGMKRAVDVIRMSSVDAKGRLVWEGAVLSSERLRREIDVCLLHQDCQADEIIVAGGDQGADPHERGHGPLRAGETIILDIFPRHKQSGYWGDLTRTVIKGKPAAAQRKLYQAVKQAQEGALQQVRAGVTGAEIHDGVCRTFEALGFKTGERNGIHQGFIHSTGHGVGLEIHEAPSISPAGGPLEAGQVITIEPGLYYPGLGAVRIEDTGVVTETGIQLLASCPKVFAL